MALSVDVRRYAIPYRSFLRAGAFPAPHPRSHYLIHNSFRKEAAQMETSTILSLAAFAGLITATPGPNTVMLAASGLAFGVRRSLPQFAGILIGFALLLAATAAGLQAMILAEPRTLWLLRLVGTVYLLWLARRLWYAAGTTAAACPTPIPLAQALVFQFVNPKAWLIAVAVVTAFAESATSHATQAVLCFLFMLFSAPILFAWVLFGAAIRRVLRTPEALRRLNRCVAVLTATTIFMLW